MNFKEREFCYFMCFISARWNWTYCILHSYPRCSITNRNMYLSASASFVSLVIVWIFKRFWKKRALTTVLFLLCCRWSSFMGWETQGELCSNLIAESDVTLVVYCYRRSPPSPPHTTLVKCLEYYILNANVNTFYKYFGFGHRCLRWCEVVYWNSWLQSQSLKSFLQPWLNKNISLWFLISDSCSNYQRFMKYLVMYKCGNWCRHSCT